MTVYSGFGAVPSSFDVPHWGTLEDSNAGYGELPAGSQAAYVPTFRVP
jgi:hypothetical protein